MSVKKVLKRLLRGFTLAELVVVITILAILAAVGFVALSGYARDAAESRTKANVRSVYSAVSSESALTGNSPRYYIVHDTGAALSGAVVFVEGTPSVLTGWQYGTPGTNYSAGNPDWTKLKLNPEKFKLSSLSESVSTFLAANAAYDPGQVLVAAAELMNVSSQKARSVSYSQVAGVSATGIPFVVGNYPVWSSWSVSGLVKDPSSSSSTGALVDGTKIGTVTVTAGDSCSAGSSWNGTSCVANTWSAWTWGTCSGETWSWGYSAWGTCSVTCGWWTQTRTATCTRNANGTQTRTVACLKYDGSTLADSDCLSAKPGPSQSCTQGTDAVCGTVGATSQACNTGACPINWACSTTAGACTAGTASWDNGATACWTTRTWTCAGLNGGTNASCSKANAVCTCQYQTIEYYGCLWDWTNACASELWAWWSFDSTATAYCVGDSNSYCYACWSGYGVAYEWTIRCKKGCP